MGRMMVLLLSLSTVAVCTAFTGSPYAPQMCMGSHGMFMDAKSYGAHRKAAKLANPFFNGVKPAYTSMRLSEGGAIPTSIVWPTREYHKATDRYEWGALRASDVFKGKRVVVFSLPGAFTPTCSSTHLPEFERLYGDIKAQGIDEVYCLSVNDSFVMNAWKESLGVSNVKMIPDGNGAFSKAVGMLVDKGNLGFGDRSWRYAMVVNDGFVEKLFVESDPRDLADSDPFSVCDAKSVLEYLKTR